MSQGKEFDALVVDLGARGSMLEVMTSDTAVERLEKFLFLGDDRNIARIFVAGKEVGC